MVIGPGTMGATEVTAAPPQVPRARRTRVLEAEGCSGEVQAAVLAPCVSFDGQPYRATGDGSDGLRKRGHACLGVKTNCQRGWVASHSRNAASYSRGLGASPFPLGDVHARAPVVQAVGGVEFARIALFVPVALPTAAASGCRSARASEWPRGRVWARLEAPPRSDARAPAPIAA